MYFDGTLVRVPQGGAVQQDGIDWTPAQLSIQQQLVLSVQESLNLRWDEDYEEQQIRMRTRAFALLGPVGSG